MEFDIRRSNQRLKGSFFFAILIHMSVGASIVLSSHLKQFPEGTGKIQVEFTAQEVSKGTQNVTTNVGKEENQELGTGVQSAPTLPQKAKSAKKLTRKIQSLPKKIVKKSAPKPAEIKTAKVKDKVVPTDNGEIPVKLPQKKVAQASESPLPEVSKEESVNVIAPVLEPVDVTDDLEREVQALSEELDREAELKEDILAAEQAEQAQAEQAQELEAKKALKKKSKSTLNKVSKNKKINLPPKMSNQSFGVKSGAKDYRDLKQRQGNVKPTYSPYARMNRLEGKGVLQYYVTKRGYVTEVSLIQSTGHKHLDKEAIRAISRYKYFPGQTGWAVHPFEFNLKGEAQQNNKQLLRTRASSKDQYPHVN